MINEIVVSYEAVKAHDRAEYEIKMTLRIPAIRMVVIVDEGQVIAEVLKAKRNSIRHRLKAHLEKLIDESSFELMLEDDYHAKRLDLK